MKQVKYNIIKYGKKGSIRFSGYGELNGNDLITRYTNKDGEEIEHIYEDCLSSLHPVLGTTDEFKGSFFEYENIEFENSKGQIISYETEVDYQIWIQVLN